MTNTKGSDFGLSVLCLGLYVLCVIESSWIVLGWKNGYIVLHSVKLTVGCWDLSTFIC